jgi:hypothetical protein
MFERYSESARRVIYLALWSARRRGGPYIEPEDLLHAIIRQDRGETTAICSQASAGHLLLDQERDGVHAPFFSSDVAAGLLRGLHEDPELLSGKAAASRQEMPGPPDMIVSRSLKEILDLAKRTVSKKSIDSLDLLAGILRSQHASLTKLLADQASRFSK